MDERREQPHGRRKSDTPSFHRTILFLLLLIVALQILMVGLHYRRPTPEIAKIPPSPDLKKPENLTGPVANDEKTQTLVQHLNQSLNSLPTMKIFIDNVHVESATDSSNIIVSGRLNHTLSQTIEKAVCRIQLLTASGDLVYQATGAISLPAAHSDENPESGPIWWIVDNPPEFDKVEIAVEKLWFEVKDYERVNR